MDKDTLSTAFTWPNRLVIFFISNKCDAMIINLRNRAAWFSGPIQCLWITAGVQAGYCKSDFLWKPSAITVLSILLLSTEMGVSKYEGTSLSPLLSVALDLGFSPLPNSTAISAAWVANSLIGLYTVMVWVPCIMRFTAARSASWPEIATLPANPCAASA